MSGSSAVRSAAPAEVRLSQALELLARAGAGPFRLGPDPGDREAASVVPGWAVVSGGSPVERRAASEILARLHRAESELESLCAEILERYEEAALVYRLSRRLSTVVGEAAIARLIVDEAAGTLGARGGELWLRSDAGIALCACLPDEGIGDAELREQGPLGVLEEGRAWIREPGAGGEPVVAVPLPDERTGACGVLVLRGRRANQPFRAADVKLLGAVANLAAAFVRNDRLAAGSRRDEARERREEVAREVRASLAAGDEPIEGLTLDVRSITRQSGAVGTDYHDRLRLPDGSVLLVVADATGQGVGVALELVMLKGALLAETRRGGSPAEILERLNAALGAGLARRERYATVALARLDLAGGRLQAAVAGHAPPILVRTQGPPDVLEVAGPALGVVDRPGYVSLERELRGGELLALYTDGVVDSRSPAGHPLGASRLTDLLVARRADAATMIEEAILEALDRHRGERPLHDDATLVLARVPERRP